ncbi:MAG TPA: NAD(P)/FAD-dependent oxidoreductase [Nitrososphaeraceae archaeon]|jgi:digeranylgeranylglycerophospholipid reductase|nr:NAD(P)/FAD-dependent oxidoreductase [Nitrososphaeraceae archaeon]
MEKKFDSVVVGGSISGLLCAREISRCGLSVAVLEEDYEIGSPEHCGGLVSLGGLKKLGIIPSSRAILNEVNKAKIFSATKGFEVSTNRDNITVLDRRELDKQVAYQAQKFGSEIRTKSLVTSINYDNCKKEYVIKTKDDIFYSQFFIDARGLTSLINNSNRDGVLQSAQYEIYADWIVPDEIIVKFDKVKYPDFFAWIIPSGNGKGKIGVAGRKINTLQTLESFIESFSSKYSIIRKIYAPIWIGGPLKNFVFNNMILVGDAAGQTKPTTAGGIFSCGMGGILAGNHLARYKKNAVNSLLNRYETDWYSIFGKEFQRMLFFRKIMERLDNKSIDAIFSLISDSDIAEISKSATFDFHSFALSQILGSKKAIKLINALLGNEFRHILN